MFNLYSQKQTSLKNKISENRYLAEKKCVENLLKNLNITEEDNEKAKNLAQRLVKNVRKAKRNSNAVAALMQEFKLSSVEGVALMCLSESLLRIPDKETQDNLIRDKITKGNWAKHLKSGNTFVNAASWGLLVTGKLVDSYREDTIAASILKVIAKGGEPLIRKGMEAVVRIMGRQFVMGQTIDSALKKAIKKEANGYKFSYDMLGEAAMNDEDAHFYMRNYINAIHAVGAHGADKGVHNSPGISVKLSAIHPRYERAKHTQVVNELYPRLKELYLLANQYQIGLFIDAEESERLEISLELLEKIVADIDLDGFIGIGFVVQAYQKRAPYVIDYVADLAKRHNNRIMLRLVKGAYWDSEIKQAQTDGLDDYPVFTRKFYTDVSYLACAQKLFEYQEQIYPLFATHNAHTLAMVHQMGQGKEYEFQCLYGMGETLYDNVVGPDNLNISCRVYAPVGSYETLLAYLIRRLLENGANSSFIHQIVDKNVLIDDLLTNPIELAKKTCGEPNPYFNLPAKIYPDGRINSKGLDLTDEKMLQKLQIELNSLIKTDYLATPLIAAIAYNTGDTHEILNPANHNDKVGRVIKASNADVDTAITNALSGFESWSQTLPEDRAQTLFNMADKLEEHYFELLNILVREAGKTLANAVSEVREAVDFCRYYATQVKNEFDNKTHKAIGVLACISPWNFPLAIFLGEISSCLAAGNCVIAKPSIQTNLIAFYAVKLFHAAGVPENVLQLVLGSGSILGDVLSRDVRIKGVIFTGSTEVARSINQNLANKDFDSVLIAETGGQNVMIVDSSALPEQVVADVISSGFDSAGQRCSALRVLYLQTDIADKVIHMLKGAMNELKVGSPMNLATDVGPVIDSRAQKTLLDHIEKMRKNARMFHQTKLSDECENGTYVAPTLIEIGSIHELECEVFGPVVHVIRFDNGELDKVIKEINSSGYGLTQGLHSRIEKVAVKVYENIKAGNIYINRNMVGAVVGVQPFGGEGMSGTGPKAGGPLYLYRLVSTKVMPSFDSELKRYDFTDLGFFINNIEKGKFTSDEVQQLTDYSEEAQLNSPITQKITLPGPTGEKNFMFFAPKGTIACFANNKFDCAKQIICALATGNNVVLPSNIETNVMAEIMPHGIKIINELNKYPEINAVLTTANYIDKNQLRKDLASREGQLVITVPETACGQYHLHLLMTERTVSINVTATGGNVELMSIVDNA